MNNFHPSSADARVFQRVVQVVPHITAPGRVLEVVAQPNTPVKTGDVLFTIDPRQFQFEVNRLEAALAAAEQAVPQLKSSARSGHGRRREGQPSSISLRPSSTGRPSSSRTGHRAGDARQAERNRETAQQAVAGAEAAEERARLAYQSNIGNENTAVAQARQQLALAKYNVAESSSARLATAPRPISSLSPAPSSARRRR